MSGHHQTKDEVSGEILDVNIVSGGAGNGAILDGVDTTIKATVFDKTNSNPVATAIVDANGDQITSLGGGTQYTEGDTDASITGTAMLWEDGSDTLRVASAAKPFPVEIIAGAGSGGTAAADDADFTAGTTSGTPAMGVYESTPTSVTDGDLGTVGITQGRRLKTSATIDAALPAGTNNIGDVDVLSSALPTGASTSAKQDTIIGHLDSVETLLGTIDADTGNISTKIDTLAGAVSGTEVQVDVLTMPTTTVQATNLDIRDIDKASDDILVYVNTVKDGSGTSLVPLVDADGHLQVDVLSSASHAVTNAGTFVVQENGAALTALQLIDDVVYTDDTSTHATGTSKGALFMAAATPTDASVNANDIGAVAMTTDRKLHVAVMDALPAGTAAIGKLAANSGVDIGDVDVTSVTPGTTASSLGKAEDAGHNSGDVGVMMLAVRNDGNTQFVTTDLDYSPISVDSGGRQLVVGPVVDDNTLTVGGDKIFPAGYLADESSTDSVDEGDGGFARMTLDRKQIVTVQPHTAGGLSVFNATSSDGATALTSTAQVIKASAGQVYGWYIYNPNATAQFVQFYNTAAASVTVGTTNPLFMLTIPATSAANVEFTNGITFSNAGFSCAATSTAGGNGAPGTALDAVIFYK